MADPFIPPYNVADLGGDIRREAPAVARNVGAIGDVLADWLPKSGLVLEVASGTGEHALAFARRFSNIDWQPSDPDLLALASIAAWRIDAPANLLEPIAIDAASLDWPIDRADAILCINMVHISPWASALGLLDGAARLRSPLILYGPWLVDGQDTAPSNLAFDTDLKSRNASWGLRLVSDFAQEAAKRGLKLSEIRPMPANNQMLLLT